VNVTRKTILAVGGMVALLVVGVAFLAWPAYRDALQIRSQTQQLLEKSQRLQGDTRVVTRLAERVRNLRTHVERDLKVIPDEPRIAEMMRRLSLPVDGITVRDQTFAAGSPKPASTQHEVPFNAVPVTVELDASFDAIFSLLRATESTPQLIRVHSVHIERSAEEGKSQVPSDWLHATLSLEAIHRSEEETASGGQHDIPGLAGIDARSTP
jgi:Tfp pilus assembly protein PilO